VLHGLPDPALAAACEHVIRHHVMHHIKFAPPANLVPESCKPQTKLEHSTVMIQIIWATLSPLIYRSKCMLITHDKRFEPICAATRTYQVQWPVTDLGVVMFIRVGG
jgi:hypothetical protein